MNRGWWIVTIALGTGLGYACALVLLGVVVGALAWLGRRSAPDRVRRATASTGETGRTGAGNSRPVSWH